MTRRRHDRVAWAPPLAVSLVFLLCAAGSDLPRGADAPVAPSESPGTRKLVPEDLGIAIVALRPTAANSMIEVRYRVLDPEKSRFLLQRGSNVRSFLVHDGTGAVLAVPATRLGAMRQSTHAPVRGRVYFSLFQNPGIVNPGDALTLVLGDYRFSGLTLAGPALSPLAERQRVSRRPSESGQAPQPPMAAAVIEAGGK